MLARPPFLSVLNWSTSGRLDNPLVFTGMNCELWVHLNIEPCIDNDFGKQRVRLGSVVIGVVYGALTSRLCARQDGAQRAGSSGVTDEER